MSEMQENPYYLLGKLLDNHGRSLWSFCDFVHKEPEVSEWEGDNDLEAFYDKMKKRLQRNNAPDKKTQKKSYALGGKYLQLAYNFVDLDMIRPRKPLPSKRIPSALDEFFASKKTLIT